MSQLSTETRKKYRKIDVHTHILPEYYPDLEKRYGYGKWVRLHHTCAKKADMYQGDKFFRAIDENCYRVEPRLREMEACGVEAQVLSTVPVMFSYWAKAEDALDLCKMLNNHIAQICRQYPKFVGLATLPLQAPELAIQELRRCMLELGMAGIQIGSHVNEWSLAQEELFPIWQECERLSASIFVHPWDMIGQDIMRKYWLPWLVGMPAETSFAICSLIFGGIFNKLPKLRWCFAHGGGSFPGTVGRVEHGWKVRPDLCAVDCKENPRTFCGKFWLDSLVHDPVALRAITDLCGVQKICLGTDYPFPLGEEHPGDLIENGEFTEEEKDDMLWKNGLQFLGLNDKLERIAYLGEKSVM